MENGEEQTQIQLNLESLGAFRSGEMATEAIHRVADELCHIPRSEASGKGALPREPMLGALRRLLLYVAAEPAERCPEKEEVSALVSQDIEDEEVADALVCGAFARREDVRAAAGGAMAAGVSGAQLLDFDWRASVTVASDKAVSMTKPTVTLGLTLCENNGVAGPANAKGKQSQQQLRVKNIVFEANDADLDMLIQQLEKASNAVAALKV